VQAPGKPAAVVARTAAAAVAAEVAGHSPGAAEAVVVHNPGSAAGHSPDSAGEAAVVVHSCSQAVAVAAAEAACWGRVPRGEACHPVPV